MTKLTKIPNFATINKEENGSNIEYNLVFLPKI